MNILNNMNNKEKESTELNAMRSTTNSMGMLKNIMGNKNESVEKPNPMGLSMMSSNQDNNNRILNSNNGFNIVASTSYYPMNMSIDYLNQSSNALTRQQDIAQTKQSAVLGNMYGKSNLNETNNTIMNPNSYVYDKSNIIFSNNLSQNSDINSILEKIRNIAISQYGGLEKSINIDFDNSKQKKLDSLKAQFGVKYKLSDTELKELFKKIPNDILSNVKLDDVLKIFPKPEFEYKNVFENNQYNSRYKDESKYKF